MTMPLPSVHEHARHVLVVASTFPASDTDPVPAFVKEFVEASAEADESLTFSVLAPHDPRVSTPGLTRRERFDEYRFRYMWPGRLQLLNSHGGIVSSLRANKALYLLVPFFVLAEFFSMLRLVRRIRPDVINAHWVIPQGIVCALVSAITGVPLVLTVHGGDVFTFNNALTVRLKRYAIRRSRRVVVNSSATLARSREIEPGADYDTIPMGVDLERFASVERVPTDALRVLFVGRLSEEKGVDDLLTALAVLRDRGIPFEARIAGTGPESDQLRARAASLGLGGAVQFLGWVARDTLVQHYRWASVFVGPSIQSASGWIEALGVVFIEASAARLPVITTDTGGMKDVVLDGVTGFIVTQRSPDLIADRLARLAADPSLGVALGEAGLEHVTTSFSWPHVAERYAALFDAVHAGR